MKHWTESSWIGFDTETTGTDPKTARILQASVITDDPSGLLVEEDRLFYIDPGVPIPPDASAIHGITAEVLVQKNAIPSAGEIPYLYGLVLGRSVMRGYPLVIYNAQYDWPLLLAECQRVPQFAWEGQPQPLFLDPLVIDRALDKYRKGSRKLDAVSAHYGVKLSCAHGARADATAALDVMRALIKVFPQLGDFDLAALQDQQARWYAEWRDHLNEYWERTGKKERVTGTWPMGSGGAE